jgi:hypothetical protein
MHAAFARLPQVERLTIDVNQLKCVSAQRGFARCRLTIFRTNNLIATGSYCDTARTKQHRRGNHSRLRTKTPHR